MAIHPFQQLDVLKKASQKGKQITDCYRLMFRKELWIRAHTKLFYPKTPNESQLLEIDELIFQLKKGRFRFENHRETLEHTTSPSYRELMVLEVIKMILNVISKDNYLKKGYLTQSLKEVKWHSNNHNWWVLGEIKCNKSSAWPQQLLKSMEKKIRDRRFFLLIHHAFFSGIINREDCNKGASLLSLLYAIYFQEMNVSMKQKMNREKRDNNSFGEIRFFPNYNHFLIGINGSKDEAVAVLNEFQLYFNSYLLYVNKDYFLCLSNLNKSAGLCGYQLKRCRRTNTVLFKIPKDTLQRLSKKYGDLKCFKPIPRPQLINLSDRQIMRVYHCELRKVVFDYRGASNWDDLSKLFSLARGSFIKTIAMKRKCSVRKVSLEMKSYKQGELCIKVRDKGEVESLYSFTKLAQFSFLRY